MECAVLTLTICGSTVEEKQTGEEEKFEIGGNSVVYKVDAHANVGQFQQRKSAQTQEGNELRRHVCAKKDV